MTTFPTPIEAGNRGDGSPLTLGDPEVIGDLFVQNGYVTVLDWEEDGRPALVNALIGKTDFRKGSISM